MSVPLLSRNCIFLIKNFTRGPAWYRAHFPTAIQKHAIQRMRKHHFVTGEASAYYLFHPHAPQRVARLLPGAKLIVLLRNPVDRAYSQYNFEVDLGRESLSFEEAITAEEERIGKERERILADERYVSFDHSRYSYLARGVYVDQLRTWMGFFPREQFLLLRSEDFYADPASALEKVSQFLQLPPLQAHERTKKYKQHNYNNTPYSSMNPATRERLVAYFEPHNQRLSNFVGMVFDWDK